MENNKGTVEVKYFSLTNFYASAFLIVKGLSLVDIKSISYKKSKFIFVDIPKRELWLRSFHFAEENSPEVMVDARQFVVAIRTLKERLYQNSDGTGGSK